MTMKFFNNKRKITNNKLNNYKNNISYVSKGYQPIESVHTPLPNIGSNVVLPCEEKELKELITINLHIGVSSSGKDTAL